MSHVIPPHVFQVLKSHRWNCNVLGVSQKVRAPELRASFGLRGAWIEFLCSVVGPTRSSWCPGRINPHAYLRTHAQNHGSTCANGAHTTARPHAPTKTPTFPHQQAEKSPYQQHAVSYNPQPLLEPRPGITKPPGPNWGRAAVAVALGFEPRVAVTPHSISSAAPSAARTRYLTRILYYTNPPTTQIDHPRWEQSHTPKPRVRAPTRTSRYAIASNSPRPPRPPRTSGSPGKA